MTKKIVTNIHTDKLQKILANKGLASRRVIEDWIKAGRVTLNGSKATLGVRATTQDIILVDGRRILFSQKVEKTKIIIYHKPAGEVCTRHDEQGRRTIFDNLPKVRGQRWISVGRLDLNTSGLLLLTTDGELAHLLMHPSNEIEREYAVRVLGKPSSEVLENLQKGVKLEDGTFHFEKFTDAGGEGANHWYHVTLKQGRNRMVRRMWESQGLVVSRLMRIRFGNVNLPRSLKMGQHIDLDEKTYQQLQSLIR